MRASNKKIVLSLLVASSLYANGNFKATIIDNAECLPKAKNDRPSKGMQENRRVDISLENEEFQERIKPVIETISSRVILEDGGAIWATSDPLFNDAHLDIKASTVAIDKNFQALEPVKFYIYNNFNDYIKRYEVFIYNGNNIDNLKLIDKIEGEHLKSEIAWDSKIAQKMKFSPKEQLLYKLRVYDKENHFDETNLKKLIIKKGRVGFEDIQGEIFGKSDIKINSIPIQGSRVRVYGSGINPNYLLKIDNQEVRVDNSGKFVYERIKKGGDYQIPITIMNESGKTYDKKLLLDVKENHIFIVGLADFTAGKYSVSGNIKPLEADEHFNEDLFIDGRLAFYLKGKIKGKYLITAQLDTQEENIKDLFKDIQKKDPQTIFRHLDPDQYYYLYGDDSTSYKDVDSQGKMYLRVEWDKSKALWGNYNSGLSGNEFANVNRSLYGAKIEDSSMDVTKYGENKRDITLFASEAQSAYAHNEFEATGGSLYYLKHKDILQGSAKVWIEIEDRNSYRVIEKKDLILGQDYEIDELQGRIILTRPISPRSAMSGPSIIKDAPLDGNRVLLKVDYEYLPDNFKANQATYGGRIKQWIGDHVALGATYAHEGRSGDDYEVKGADLTYRAAKKSYVKAEFAQSKSLQSNGANYYSIDGGIRFKPIDSNSSDISGNAYGLEAKLALSDFKKVKNDTITSFWYKKRQKGYSNARVGSNQDVDDYGIEATTTLADFIKLKTRATTLKEDKSKQQIASLEGDITFNRVTIGSEIRYIKHQIDDKKTGKGTLAGLLLQYNFNSYFDLYTKMQTTINHEGDYTKNDLYTIGAKTRYNKLTLDAELSTGDRGDGAQIGADYAISDNYSIYSNYILSTDSTEGKRDIVTVGQRAKISDALSIFTEHQFSHSNNMAGVGNTFGIDYAFSRYLLANLTYNKVNYDDQNKRDRDAISASLKYSKKDLLASTKAEYREDKGNNLHQKQYLTTNRVSYRLNPSYKVMAKFNYSKTIDEIDHTKEATFTESGVGFAYRPTQNSRFNLIGKYTYLYDLSSLDQIKSNPDEKSHIISMEMSYQLSSKWSIGAKLGAKKYSLRTNRDDGEWYESKLYLGALRANYHLIRSWDALLEFHTIKQKDDGIKSGFLTGIYKHLGEHVKLGVGYNFTHFSDDLTDKNDYDAKGWFINVIGKF